MQSFEEFYNTYAALPYMPPIEKILRTAWAHNIGDKNELMKIFRTINKPITPDQISDKDMVDLF